jgi:dTDP-4-dehydrorhamnose reductase
MRILVTGATGRLGAAMVAELTSLRHQTSAFGHDTLDVGDEDQVKAVMDRVQPDVIVNCSAYNAVDAAEADGTAACRVNVEGPSHLAAAANAAGALFVHYSTDFVFDGRSRRPYSEDDPTHPLSVYGRSKLAGEHEARKAGRHYVLRLASLFGGQGLRGHQATIDRLAKNLVMGVPVRAQVDRTVSPSYVPDVVRATLQIVECNVPFGTYHCVNSGWTTWYGLANELARQLGSPARVVPVDASDLPGAAPRPRFCALSNHKLAAHGIEMPSWRSALGRHIPLRGGHDERGIGSAVAYVTPFHRPVRQI